MTGSERFRFYYATSSSDAARAGTRTPISRANLHAKDWRLMTLTSPAPPPDPWAQDLWDIILGVHIADRFALRDQADDRWTRRIDIDLPVTNPDLWTDAAQEMLANLLEVSTGDRWTLRLRPWRRSTPFAIPRCDEEDAEARASHVALFSGGLDSTAYAAQLARAGTDALLVTFTRPRLRPVQDAVLADIRQLANSMRLRQVDPIPMDPRARRDKNDPAKHKLEMSSRSRGLLYATTAVYIAAAYHATTVAVPENGQLAINPPLSPARGSACSTRSAHPWVLHQLNNLITELGGGIRVTNPLLNYTKAEVCTTALDAGLSAATLFATISCGKPPNFHDANKPEHCGLCVACLMRRSGLRAALGYDHTTYLEPSPQNASKTRVADVAALARWHGEPFRTSDLLADLPLPADHGVEALMDVLTRGRTEIGDLLQHFRTSDPNESHLATAA